MGIHSLVASRGRSDPYVILHVVDEAARAHAEKVADDFAKVFQRATAVRVINDLGEVVFINRSA